MKTDIEIAQSCPMKPICEIAAKAGLSPDRIEPYGNYKAKILPPVGPTAEGPAAPAAADAPTRHRLILVTAINPTPAGEGKTTTTIGLADALSRLGKKTMVALREPSLGPVFGIKGGAAGGGYAQVVPMEDINLHFTGDFHAIGAANNLLAAMLDNHIQHGNALNIDPRRICWKRCVDMNDRQLRHVLDGLGGKANGTPREDGFDITVASEVMAILCLSDGISDLKERLGRIIVGYTYGGKPVTASDLKAAGAMAALLKDAIKPNLVQTLEGTPALIHGGPFANIAHGCNSVAATKLALSLADYTVTEAGFGADLGAEKFIDIKCRMAGLQPDAVVIVATVRALKYNGGVPKAALTAENTAALERGLPNLLRHVENITQVFGLPCVVAVNRFPTDTDAELDLITRRCREMGVNVALSEVWAKGSAGGEALAYEVLRLCDRPVVADDHIGHPSPASAVVDDHIGHPSPASAVADDHNGHPSPVSTVVDDHIGHPSPVSVVADDHIGHPAPASAVADDHNGHPALTCRGEQCSPVASAGFRFAYALELPLRDKIKAIAKRIYRARHVSFLPAAEKQLTELEGLGFGGLPVCMAKTQYSFTDDASVLGAPEGFTITVRQLKISAGAGFIVALTGDIMTMPGLPKSPAAERIDVDDQGRITGLF